MHTQEIYAAVLLEAASLGQVTLDVESLNRVSDAPP